MPNDPNALPPETPPQEITPTTHRSGVVHPTIGPNRLTFAYVDPQRRLSAVIDAGDLKTAWLLATGWGDDADIEDAKAKGWTLRPCIVEWTE